MFFKKIKPNISKPELRLYAIKSVYYVLLLSSIFLLLSTCKKPVDLMVLEIQQIVTMFGLLIVLIQSVLISFYRACAGGGFYVAFSCLGDTIIGAFVLSSVLWMIGERGDNVKNWVAENPDNANIVIISLIIIWFIIQVSAWMSPRGQLGERSVGAVAYSPMPQAIKPSSIKGKDSVGIAPEKDIDK